MNEWHEIAINELCELIVDCVNKTAPTTNANTPYKMIRTTNVRDGWIDTENVRRVDEATYRKWTRRAIPQREDVILTREAPLGEVGLLRTDEPIFLGQRLMMYRADRQKSDPRFLLYALMSEPVQAQLRSFGSGATVEHVRVPDCERLVIRAPGVDEQRRIGNFLGTIDDLIENNRRRVELLEQIVETIYREWFISLRYPGYESAKFVDSSLGLIPENWNIFSVDDAVEINPTVKAQGKTEVPFVSMSDLSDHLMTVAPSSAREFAGGGSRFERFDTLLARITPSIENGKTGFVQFLVDGCVGKGSTEFIVMRSKLLSPYSVYLLARREDFRRHAIGSMTGASGRQRVNNECFRTFHIPVSLSIEAQFAALAAPIFAQCQSLSEQVNCLTAMRTLLLPVLVTGQLDVPELRIEALAAQEAAV